MGVLDGKVAVVTGASSGMGRATAILFAAEGATVALAARRADSLGEVAGEIEASGGSALAIPTDVTDRAQTEQLAARTVERFGRLDLLVNSAGTNIPGRSLRVLSDEDWAMMLATNLTGSYYLTQAVLPRMREAGDGIIIHISSVSVQRPDVSGVAYQATKHGQVGLTHGTMQEEKKNGVRVTVIFPGLTDTPILEKRPAPTPAEMLAVALKPEDIARACLFVAGLPPRAYVPELQILPSGLA